MLMRAVKYTREECSAIRSMLLNDINRKINAQLKIDKELLRHFGRCYYIVKIVNPNTVEVIIVAGEAALSEKRSALQNKQLYALQSYFGRVNFDGKECRFQRELKINDTVTYAEGRKLLSFKLNMSLLAKRHPMENIKAAFQYYRSK